MLDKFLDLLVDKGNRLHILIMFFIQILERTDFIDQFFDKSFETALYFAKLENIIILRISLSKSLQSIDLFFESDEYLLHALFVLLDLVYKAEFIKCLQSANHCILSKLYRSFQEII